MVRKFLRELGLLFKSFQLDAIVSGVVVVFTLITGFNVNSPIIFGFTLIAIPILIIIILQITGGLLIWLSKLGYKPVAIDFPKHSPMNAFTLGKGVHPFIIRNRDPYDKLENCYAKLGGVYGLIGNEQLPVFAEQVYSKKLSWQGWASSDGNISIGKADEEPLNIIEVGDSRFRFLFQGDTHDEDCDSSEISLGEGLYGFKIRLFGDVRGETYIREQSYIAEFETALNMESQTSSISHLIIWELEEFIKRQRDGWKETTQEVEARREFRERLNKQVRILIQEQNQKDRKENNSQEQESKLDIPKFYTRTHHAEFVIKDSNAEAVAKYILQYLDDIPMLAEGENYHITTEGGTFYSPQKDGISQHAFVARGRKVIARHGYFNVGQAKMTADPHLVDIPEMFFITVVQGGQNIAQVKFDTDDIDVFLSYSQGLLKELQEVFTVTSVKGLPREPELIITTSENGEFEFRNGEVYKVARMNIFNNTEREITKCYATLQNAKDILFNNSEPKEIPSIPSMSNVNRPDRIKWNEEQDMNEQCEMAIPLKDARHLDVADTFGTFHYNLRHGKADANWTSVLHTVQIRVDYVIGTDANYVEFEGYIYAANFGDAKESHIKKGRIKKAEEINKDQITHLKMIFKEGNWTTNNDIKHYLQISRESNHEEKDDSNR